MSQPTFSAVSDPPGETGALVLFSGGQDSSTCLAWALERFARVETVGFDYGQRHGVEMQARVRRCAPASSRAVPALGRVELGEDHVLDLRGFRGGGRVGADHRSAPSR